MAKAGKPCGDANYKRMNGKKGFRQKILQWLGLSTRPTVKVYRGHGTANQVVIYGHVLRLSPLPRRRYRQTILANTLALLRLFMVRPMAGATVQLAGPGPAVRARTDAEGFFKLEWNPGIPYTPGWHTVVVELITTYTPEPTVLAQGEGSVLVPHPTQFGCISDIDDTFLISHSSHLRKRLHVLLTENALSRDPFEGVVEHYRLLACLGTGADQPNPFFYVSSSEWNLYDYIGDFSAKNNLPRGVYLLSPLKRLRNVYKTGQGKHMTKFTRIVRILEAYPEQRFILLGDDTQEDPVIYASLTAHFPQQIACVYLRQVEARNREETREQVARIEAAGIPCCYFRHSEDAMEHTRRFSSQTA